MSSRSRPCRSRSRSATLLVLLWLLAGGEGSCGESTAAPPVQLKDLAEAEQVVAEGQALARQETTGSLRLAAEKLEAAAVLFRAEGQPSRELRVLMELGEAYQALGEPGKALATADRALALSRQIEDSGQEAASLTRLGVAALETGDPDRALASFRLAVELFRSQQDKRGEGTALNGLGRVLESLGQQEPAKDVYAQALAASRSTQDRREEASILNNLGMLGYRAGDSEEALRRFEEALPLMRIEGYRRGEAAVLNNLGLASEALGDKQRAADSYRILLSVARALGDPLLEGVVHNNLGTVLFDLGDAEQALEQHHEALAKWRGAQHPANEAVTLNNLGVVYDSLGEWDLALEHYHQALRLRRMFKDRRGEATTLSNIAAALTRLDDLSTALEQHTQALAVFRELGDRRKEAGVLNNMGRTHTALGNERQALELYRQAEVIRREIGDRLALSGTLQNRGAVLRSLGDLDPSQQAYAEALSLAQELGDRPGEASIRLGRSLSLQRAGKREEALAEVRLAVEILEGRRKSTNSENLRTSMSAGLRDYYEQYLELLIEPGAPETSSSSDGLSLEISERARSRGLLDTLLEARAEIRRGAEPELLESERQLQRRINLKELEWRDHLRQNSPTEISEGRRQELEQLLRQLDEVRARIRFLSPAHAALTQPELLGQAEIQALLDEDSLLLSYFLGKNRSFVWAVTRSSLVVRELPARREIEAAARELHALLLRSDRRLAHRPAERAARRLAQMVLGPVEGLLGHRRLVVIPDGALHYIPFASLPDPDRPELPLAVEHEIVNLPSASVLAVLRRPASERKSGPPTVAILADPVFAVDDSRVRRPEGGRGTGPPPGSGPVLRAARDVGLEGFPRLLSTRTEAEAIAALVPTSRTLKALDFDANKEAATDGRLAGFQLLHFATHGLLDTRRPELSGLVLSLVDREGRSRDGFLRLHEIYNLNLPSDLVVLSGCETALGKEARGEGLIALTRGFMHAGARAVIASLWRVDDRTTAELMRRFYQALLHQGLPPAAALREAQLSLRANPRTSAPYFWAGFVIQGDWAPLPNPDSSNSSKVD